jgi:hypothetical protein
MLAATGPRGSLHLTVQFDDHRVWQVPLISALSLSLPESASLSALHSSAVSGCHRFVVTSLVVPGTTACVSACRLSLPLT